MSLKAESPIVIVGLGYVGLTLAAFMSDNGFQIHGTELRKSILDQLRLKKSYFYEENLDNILERVISKGSFTFSENIPKASINRTFIITVGTPLLESREANLEHIINCAREVAEAAIDDDFVILRSTVKLGVTNRIVRPILEATGKKIGLAFCPERTLEGAAISELGKLPQIIGANTEREKLQAGAIFNKLTSSIVMVSNIETAELIKLTDNIQRDIHFAISNEVAMAANKFNIKASEVISAGKIGYPRTNLASPGPVGGPCLEKDPHLFAESLGWSESLAQTARKINTLIVPESIEFISSQNFISMKKHLRISLLGLAFKGAPETNDLRGSISLQIYNSLKSRFPESEILCFDPMITKLEADKFGINLFSTVEESFEKADLVLITNNNKIFSSLDIDSLSLKMNSPGFIYDYWGRFDNQLKLNTGVTYSSWGSHGVLRAATR